MSSRKKSQAVCPVCDSVDYILRDGAYFCMMCNTQSQELGQETVMDNETIPFGVQGQTDKISLGSKGSRSSKDLKRKLSEGVHWGKAEACSWVIRGWIECLAKHGVDVQYAVIQLWTKYLRELNMAFEKKGTEGGAGIHNLAYRDRWNMIGGPPTPLSNMVLYHCRKRRLTEESLKKDDDENEIDEDREETLVKRKLRRKKRKKFYQALSSATSETDTASRPGTSISGASSGDDCESDYSEGGYLTDAQSLSAVMERFSGGSRSEETQVAPKLGYSNNFESTLPNKLCIRYMAALITLAVIGRPMSSITISDMVNMFNQEWLPWRTASSLLPNHYKTTQHERRSVTGEITLHSDILSIWVHRLAAFLSPENETEQHINLVSMSKLNSNTKTTFEPVLARVLLDLSLPSNICSDITRICKQLLLCNISGSLVKYDPSDLKFQRDKFPLVMQRVMGLIILAIKFHCGMDDQYEIYMDHNIEKLKSLSGDNNHFSLLPWIRLSKLRLDYLMSVSGKIRRQYHLLATIGTPNLTSSVLAREKIEDDKMAPSPSISRPEQERRLNDLSRLMEDLDIEPVSDPMETSCDPGMTLNPLFEATKLMLKSEEVDNKVKVKVEKLLTFSNMDMRFHYEKGLGSMRYAIKDATGIDIHKDDLPTDQFKKIQLDRNWIFSCGGYNKSMKQGDQDPLRVNFQSRAKYAETIYKGRSEWSNCRIPQPDKCPEYWFLPRKQYWFSSPDGMTYEKTLNDTNIADKLFSTLPSSYSWTVRFLALRANICPIQLHKEVANIERLIQELDPLYFGKQELFYEKRRFKGDCPPMPLGESEKRQVSRARDLGLLLPRKEEMIKCEQCYKRFGSTFMLEVHVKRKHQEVSQENIASQNPIY